MHVIITYIIIVLIPQHISVLFPPTSGGRNHLYLKKFKRHIVYKMVTIKPLVVSNKIVT
jgi:hypothetical protein